MCKTLLCCHFVLYLQSPDSCPTWKLHEGYNLNPGKTSRPLVTHFLPLQHINFLFDSFSSTSHKFQLSINFLSAGLLLINNNTNVNFLWKLIWSGSHQADIFRRGLFSDSSSSSGLPRISLKNQVKKIRGVSSPEMLCLEIKLPRLLPIIASSVQHHALLDQQRVVIGCPEEKNDNPFAPKYSGYVPHPNIWSVAARRRLFGVQMWELIHAWVKEKSYSGVGASRKAIALSQERPKQG